MEKKNNKRGLEEISHMFLSSGKKQDEKPVRALSAFAIRTDASCISCTHLIMGSSRELKCRIFSIEHQKYGVPHLANIVPSYANYCENYEPEGVEDPAPSTTTPSPEPEQNALGAPKQNNKVDMKRLAALISELDQDFSEIEETVSVHKKIAYPDTDKAGEGIQKALYKFVEHGYRIRSVELVKRTEEATSKGRQISEEKVSLFVKE